MLRSIDTWMAGIFWLILFFLVFTHGKNANTLLSTSINGGNSLVRNLQGR